MFYIETEKAKEYGYRYEVRTGSGMTTVNVQVPNRSDGGQPAHELWKDVDCFTINEDVTEPGAFLHIMEWEQGQQED